MQHDTIARTTAISTVVIILALAALGMFGSAFGGRTPAAQAAAPTPDPIIIIASPTPGMARLVVAYAAPDGAAFPGALDLNIEALTLVGRHGGAWAQAQRSDGSRVWLHSTNLPIAWQDAIAAQPEAIPAVAAAAPIAVSDWQPPVQQPAPAPIDSASKAETPPAPLVDAALNDPAQNGGNIAPPGCPFPIVNGTCANGAPVVKDSEEGVKIDTRDRGQAHVMPTHP